MEFKPAAWVMLIGCSLGGVLWAMRTELQRDYYGRHERWNEAPFSFIAACGNAALLGVGTGMSVAVLTLIVAALIVRAET